MGWTEWAWVQAPCQIIWDLPNVCYSSCLSEVIPTPGTCPFWSELSNHGYLKACSIWAQPFPGLIPIFRTFIQDRRYATLSTYKITKVERGWLTCLVNSQAWNLTQVCPRSSRFALLPLFWSIAGCNTVPLAGTGMEEWERQQSQDLYRHKDVRPEV